MQDHGSAIQVIFFKRGQTVVACVSDAARPREPLAREFIHASIESA